MPRNFLWLDTEARKEVTNDIETQTWRLAVTCFDGYNDRTKRERPAQWCRWTDPLSMWQYVDSIAPHRSRLIITTHNVGYDARIGLAMYILPDLGWTLSRFGVHERAVTMTWKRADKATLVFVDSTSYLPMGLDKVASLIGMEKQPLPNTEDEVAWWARCTRDVEILRTAMRQIWDYCRDNDLGNWQRTGAAMAWSNWRHKHYTHRVTIHEYEQVQQAEAASTYTARCEAWRHGTTGVEPLTEWDLPCAYARIARDVELPTCFWAHHFSLSMGCLTKRSRGKRFLCRATITTEVPCLPTASDNGFLWPTGTFSGWYWDVELGTAMLGGATVKVHEAWSYRATPALKDWAEWVIGVVDGTIPDVPPAMRETVKHWGRALIGKFAAKYPDWKQYGKGLGGSIQLLPMYDRDTKETERLLFLGDTTYKEGDNKYGNDACPAIQSAIMAEARCRLWYLMQTAGLDNVVYVDTDGLITTAEGSNNLRKALETNELWGLRPKRVVTELRIYGPRQLTVNGSIRFAGVSNTAKWKSSSEMHGQRWQSFGESLNRGLANQVVIYPAKWLIQGIDKRREHLPDGSTRAFAVGDDLGASQSTLDVMAAQGA